MKKRRRRRCMKSGKVSRSIVECQFVSHFDIWRQEETKKKCFLENFMCIKCLRHFSLHSQWKILRFLRKLNGTFLKSIAKTVWHQFKRSRIFQLYKIYFLNETFELSTNFSFSRIFQNKFSFSQKKKSLDILKFN